MKMNVNLDSNLFVDNLLIVGLLYEDAATGSDKQSRTTNI